MAKNAIIYGAFLILLGVGGYVYGAVATEKASITALIPAFIGLPVVILGAVALKGSDNVRKHTMHVNVVIALLAAGATARGVMGMFTMIGGGEVERPAAVISQTLTALASVIFIVLAVKSFIDARKAMAAQPQD